MNIEVNFSSSESALLASIMESRADALRERWNVETIADLVRLLAMHGADEIESIPGIDGK